MSKYRVLVASVAFVAVLAIAGSAFARTIASYDLVVPRLGGTVYTGSLTKVNYSRGVDNNTSNGAGYSMYTAIYHPSTTRVTPSYGLASGSRILISYNAGQNMPGTGYRLGHTNKLTTIVNVQSSGSWSPDEY
ncbi:MAG: hypothetical protein Q7W30_05005 [Coriobacteriia bacterium]|nr:hypothetical protein [Coriobacteriia bacterium]